MPLIAGAWAAATYLIGIVLPELATPFADRFIGHNDAAGEEHFLDIAVAEGEPKVEPDGMGDDLWGKAMVFVALRLGVRGHVGGPSGSAAAHMRVGDRPIMPPRGKTRHKLTKPKFAWKTENFTF